MRRVLGGAADTWVRGANPWCGWLRLVTLPLALLALYHRSLPLAAVALIAGIGLPRLFRKPTSHEAWMTRAAYGVRIFRSRPFAELEGLSLFAAGAACLLLAAMAAWQGRLPSTLAGGGLWLACALRFLARSARLLEERRGPGAV